MIDDPAAVLSACPTFPPTVEWRRKPLWEVSIELEHVSPDLVSPDLVDLLMYGQSPGPHIVLGEN